MAVEGGEEKLVLDALQDGYWGYWGLVDEGIYFVDAKAQPRPAISFYSLATGETTRVATMEKPPVRFNPGFTVSPDGRSILYAQMDQVIMDIMLMEDFR